MKGLTMHNKIKNLISLKKWVFVFMLLATNMIFAQTYHVNSISALTSTVAAASPGDVIELADGTYNTPFSLSGNGTETNPIIVKAATVNGVVMTQLLTMNSNWVTISGFKFTGTAGSVYIGTNTTGCRITRCSFVNSLANSWIITGTSTSAGARKIEIDYCLFDNKTNNTNGSGDRVVVKLWVEDGQVNESHHIHHNHFRDIPPGNASNGFEVIQLIAKGNPADPIGNPTNILVEKNFFERAAGEIEIISVKNNGTILRGNTFRDSNGNGIVLRQGSGSIVDGNFFFNMPGGVVVNDSDHTISNNHFENISKAGVGFYEGTDVPFLNAYVQVVNANVHSNTFVNNRYAIQTNITGQTYSDNEPVKDSQLLNNKMDVGTGWSAIRYGSIPINVTYEGNIADGTLGITLVPGITLTDIPPMTVGDGVLSENLVGPYAIVVTSTPADGPFIMSPSGLE